MTGQKMTADLHPLVKKKLQYMYDVFYDINKDGKISMEDFDVYLARITKTNKWTVGDNKHTHALSTLNEIWEGLLAKADDDNDKEVSIDEWFHMWKDCVDAAEKNSDYPAWLKKYQDFMFNVADTSGDGIVDADEFHAAYVEYGLTKENTQNAFSKVTVGGVVLNKENYEKLWHEFFLSKDASDPGNYLFGDYTL